MTSNPRLRTMRQWMLCVLAAGTVCALSTEARADDISTIRQRALDAETGGASADPNVTAAQANIVAKAKSALSSIQANGSWADLDYTGIHSHTTFGPADHFSRLHSMAAAYNIAGQSLYQEAALATAIEHGISYVQAFYAGAQTPADSNWWFWEIGTPNDFSPTLLLMQGHISTPVFDAAVASLSIYLGADPVGPPPKVSGAPVNVGENLIWNALNHMYVGLIQSDAARLAKVEAAFDTACLVIATGLDGIQPDGSFQQHGAQLYTGGYGQDFASDVSRYLELSSATAYAPSTTSADAFVKFLATGTAWTLYGNHYDVSVISREVTRVSETASSGLDALLRMSVTPSSEQAAITAAAKAMLATWPASDYGVDVAALPGLVLAKPDNAAWPSGHLHFPNSDHSVHRRASWYASIKMLSTRILSGELINTEGKTGSRSSDGRLYLTLDGSEHYENNVWPTMDWTRLPGITVEQKADTADSTYGKGTKSFVGGTGDGQNGVSAMDFAAVDSAVTAKKAWVFFDDAIVFLANDIACPTANTVETIVEQWPMSAASTAVVVDGTAESTTPGWTKPLTGVTWVAAGGNGYYFPDQPTVSAKLVKQTGAWSDLGTGTATVQTNTFFTLWFDHGTQVTGGKAAYIVVPKVSSTDMATWAAMHPISIVQNDTTASAAKDSRNNALGVVFWQPATVSTIASDTPAVVYVVDDGTTVTVAAADPAQGKGTFNLTIGIPNLIEVSSSPGVTVSPSANSVSLTVPETGGLTSVIVLGHKGVVGPDGGLLDGGAASAGAGGSAASGGAGGNNGGAGGAGSSGASAPAAGSGCGCEVSGRSSSRSSLFAAWLGVMAALFVRRRRIARTGR